MYPERRRALARELVSFEMVRALRYVFSWLAPHSSPRDVMTARHAHRRRIRKLKEALVRELCARLEEGTVDELMLNPDGWLFFKPSRWGRGCRRLGRCRRDRHRQRCPYTLSGDRCRPIGRFGGLRIDGHRFERVLPPVVAAPTFSIRRRASRFVLLSSYVVSGEMSLAQHYVVVEAITARRNIVVPRRLPGAGHQSPDHQRRSL